MEHYSLASHWKKLIDFSNLTSDFNLYVAGDKFALASADFNMVLTRQISSPRGRKNSPVVWMRCWAWTPTSPLKSISPKARCLVGCRSTGLVKRAHQDGLRACSILGTGMLCDYGWKPGFSKMTLGGSWIWLTVSVPMPLNYSLCQATSTTMLSILVTGTFLSFS